ncbi:MAG: hypothetical protein JXX28_06960 [Deltaproteobacteria bacterium]|nr:hypothetical protein [Deltaproteobacteria bacterium]
MGHTSGDPLRVVVADPSATYRIVLSHGVKAAAGCVLVATVSSPAQLLQRLAEGDVQVLVLSEDLDPEGRGDLLTTLTAQHPRLRVILAASNPSARHRQLARELRLAGLVLRSSGRGEPGGLEAVLTGLSAAPGEVRPPVRSRRTVSAPEAPSQAPPRDDAAGTAAQRISRLLPHRFALLAIASSTGGPSALTRLFSALSPQMRLPVVLVQHMPAGFTKSLAAQLSRVSPLEVREAEQGDALRSGLALLAPGGRHMEVLRDGGSLTVRLHDEPPVNQCRPAADVLFRSLAGLTAAPVLSVVLTGMGADGAQGVGELRQFHGYNLSQDQESSVVYGMPKAVADLGFADEILSLDRIAPRLNELGSRCAVEQTR